MALRRIFSVLVLALFLMIGQFGIIGDVSAQNATTPSATTPTSPPSTTIATNETMTVGIEDSRQPTSTGTNTRSNVSIEFDNQTSNGTSVTVRNATLPEDGFLVAHSYSLQFGLARESTIAATDYLTAGTYRNVTIHIDRGVRGADQNQTRLRGSQNISVAFHRDSPANQRFDFVRSYARNDTIPDTPGAITTARITVPDNESATTASIGFDKQLSNGRTVIVSNATLPDGGFVTIRNTLTLPPENDSFDSLIGVSEYIGPNESVENRPISLFAVPGRSFNQSRLTGNRTLVAGVSRDTNDNRRYDYSRSDGTNDTRYVVCANNTSRIVREEADVAVNTSAGVKTTTKTGGGEPINPGGIDAGNGILGTIASYLQGPLFTLFIVGAFVLFVAVFGYQVLSNE